MNRVWATRWNEQGSVDDHRPNRFAFKGAWMEFATDINNVMYAYIDRKKKFPVTTLLAFYRL